MPPVDATAATPRPRGLVVEPTLDRVPDVRINDSGVLAFVDVCLVPDATCIDRVGEYVMDLASVEVSAAALSPIRSDALAASKTDAPGLFFHSSDPAQVSIQPIEHSDGLRLWRQYSQCSTIGLISHGDIAAHPEAFLLGGGYLVGPVAV